MAETDISKMEAAHQFPRACTVLRQAMNATASQHSTSDALQLASRSVTRSCVRLAQFMCYLEVRKALGVKPLHGDRAVDTFEKSDKQMLRLRCEVVLPILRAVQLHGQSETLGRSLTASMFARAEAT